MDALSKAAAIMEAHPVTLRLRTLQTLTEIAVDKNSTVIVPAPSMTAIQDIAAYLARERLALPVAAPADGVAGRPA